MRSGGSLQHPGSQLDEDLEQLAAGMEGGALPEATGLGTPPSPAVSQPQLSCQRSQQWRCTPKIFSKNTISLSLSMKTPARWATAAFFSFVCAALLLMHGCFTAEEHGYAGFRCLKEDVAHLMDLFTDVLTSPALPQEEIDLNKNQVCLLPPLPVPFTICLRDALPGFLMTGGNKPSGMQSLSGVELKGGGYCTTWTGFDRDCTGQFADILLLICRHMNVARDFD